MGTEVSKDGKLPDVKKVEAIERMPKPENKKDLKRLLGMLNYVAKFIPNESTLTAPLRSLLKEDVDFQWQPEQDQAFDKLKELLSSRPVLRYYDVEKPVTVQCDASQFGLGACLLQENQPVAYASRSLTTCEMNYSQVEKELLSVVFGCQKFHQYVFGKEIRVQNDHKPLLGILKKPMCKSSPRVQRLRLKLASYRTQMEWLCGSKMYLADTLSRAPVGAAESILEDDEVIIHTLVENMPISSLKRGEIEKSTCEDPALQELKKLVMRGWSKYKTQTPISVRQYWPMRDEINVREDLIFRGDRIIIPTALRPEMLDIIHESHLGMEKCKTRASQVIFWPGMSREIEEKVEKCGICLTFRSSNVKEPMKPHEIPSRPWQKVGADLFEVKGRDYLVVADYFSKFPEVVQVHSKTAGSIIKHMKAIYSRHGIPEELVCDNVPFSSYEFREYAKKWGFVVTTSSPTYPQSNGLSERMVQTMKSLIRKAEMDGRDPYLALLEYRNSPVAGMPFSPAQMLMSRLLRSKIPSASKLLSPKVVKPENQLRRNKESQVRYYNRGSKTLPSLQPGDVVRIRRGKYWKPAIVERSDCHPRSYIVAHEGREFRRNRRDLLKSSEPAPAPVLPELDDSPTNSEPTDSSVSHAGCACHEKSPVVRKQLEML